MDLYHFQDNMVSDVCICRYSSAELPVRDVRSPWQLVTSSGTHSEDITISCEAEAAATTTPEPFPVQTTKSKRDK